MTAQITAVAMRGIAPERLKALQMVYDAAKKAVAMRGIAPERLKGLYFYAALCEQAELP